MKTKVNMKSGIFDKICGASEILNISRSDVIKLLVKNIEKNHYKFVACNKNVKYQSRGNKGECRQFHLCLSEIEYECFTDMRKFYKMSVSLIIAVCVDLYLESLLQKKSIAGRKIKEGDNYPDILFSGHGIIYKTTNSGHKFTVYWGYPEN